MAFKVPDLPYDYNALEPYIDEETMHFHHDKHHAAGWFVIEARNCSKSRRFRFYKIKFKRFRKLLAV